LLGERLFPQMKANKNYRYGKRRGKTREKGKKGNKKRHEKEGSWNSTASSYQVIVTDQRTCHGRERKSIFERKKGRGDAEEEKIFWRKKRTLARKGSGLEKSGGNATEKARN